MKRLPSRWTLIAAATIAVLGGTAAIAVAAGLGAGPSTGAQSLS